MRTSLSLIPTTAELDQAASHLLGVRLKLGRGKQRRTTPCRVLEHDCCPLVSPWVTQIGNWGTEGLSGLTSGHLPNPDPWLGSGVAWVLMN